jgi:hypothetical protein
MNETPKRGKGGRPPKNDPAENCLMVRFSDAQYAEFLTRYEQSGIHSKVRFILARVFGEALRVIKTDSSAVDYVMKLSALYGPNPFRRRELQPSCEATVHHFRREKSAGDAL